MGYFFRKSAGFGPFRLNFSKSGIGASVGVKGARLTVTPRGTTYVTVGSHGFYYRETLAGGRHSEVGAPTPDDIVPKATPSKDEIITADASDLVDSSSERLLQELNDRASMGNPAIFVYCLAGLLLVFGLVLIRDGQSANTAMFLMPAALVAMVLGVVVHKQNTKKRTSRLFYELDESEQQKHSIVQQALAHLAQSRTIWRVEADSATSDWKRNAGASSLVRRRAIAVGNSNPPRVETNVVVPCINMGTTQLFFLPDLILCWQGGIYGGVAYEDLRVEQGSTRFIEGESVPDDSILVDHTWRYVNKNGGPDRRFNNNVQLPILQYGVLVITSSKGLNIQLNTSSVQQSLAFANCWRGLLRRQTPRPEVPQTPPQNVADTTPGPKVQALKMLGLRNGASDAEVTAAYRRLAQMYHPDKVTGLAPEFQTLADKRMKEINAAYEVLKPRAEGATPAQPNTPSAQPARGPAERPDIAAAFARESDKARTLVLEHGQYWEYLLTEELLRARLSVLNKEYDGFDMTLGSGPGKPFSGMDYVRWLNSKTNELLTQALRCMEQLTSAWGKPGEPGDPIQILSAVNEIIDCCRTFLTWELEIRSAEPPQNLKRLGAALRGITRWIIGDFNRFLNEIGRGVEEARMGTGGHSKLAFSTSPQIAKFADEMEKVNKRLERPIP